MKFCEVCANMMYIRTGTTMIMYCKHCSHEASQAESLISTVQSGDGHADYKQFLTTDLRYDRTLPRVRHIPCPNPDCTSTDKTREVIYVKYDNVNLKYLYHCCTCDQFWTSA